MNEPRFEKWLPALLSVIADMVDLSGFLSLGNLFTAHITGNLVVIAALIVRGERINPGQILAILVFMIAVVVTWLIARASGRRGPGLMRLLLLIQFLLITSVLVFSVITKPSADPHGLMATLAAMIAVSAMACQFALLRLALPVAPSTAVMTGNLTNACLALVDATSRTEPLMTTDAERLRGAGRCRRRVKFRLITIKEGADAYRVQFPIGSAQGSGLYRLRCRSSDCFLVRAKGF